MRTLYRILLLFSLLPAVAAAQSADDELVRIKELIPDIVLDVKYATTDNFTHQKLYTIGDAMLARGAVRQLQLVQDSLRKMGLGLKIYDGYRPRAIQFLMWEIVPDPMYVADPNTGSNHNRGAAVDLSLVDRATGKELAMPTPFDWFGPEAGHGWLLGLSAEQVANRTLLKTMMEHVGGFASYDSEWWHYTHNPSLANPLLDFQMK
jgi:D-alanyl-D-alanine dipeptidase